MRLLLIGLLAVALSGCVTTKPILQPDQTGQIVDVEVVKVSEDLGTKNLEEDIRVKTQNVAYRYSETGPEKTLKVQVTRYQGANPGMALLVSTGSSSLHALVTVVDNTTGAKSSPAKVWAQNFRTGGILGAIAASLVDPVEDEQRLATQLAENIVKKVYGDEAAKRAVGRTPTKTATADYPISYAEESKRIECKSIRIQNAQDVEEASETGEAPFGLRTVPDYCARFPAETS